MMKVLVLHQHMMKAWELQRMKALVESSVESEHSRGVITRSRSRYIGKLAMSTCGKFLENDDLVTDDLAHNHVVLI